MNRHRFDFKNPRWKFIRTSKIEMDFSPNHNDEKNALEQGCICNECFGTGTTLVNNAREKCNCQKPIEEQETKTIKVKKG